MVNNYQLITIDKEIKVLSEWTKLNGWRIKREQS